MIMSVIPFPRTTWPTQDLIITIISGKKKTNHQVLIKFQQNWLKQKVEQFIP